MTEVKFKRLWPESCASVLPAKAHEADAGWDLVTPEAFRLVAGEARVVPLGFALEIPPGYFGLIAGRSGLAANGVFVSGGVIDSGYRGEVSVVLTVSSQWVDFLPGARVAQLLILPLVAATFTEAAELADSPRGGAGFGSTGR